VGARRRAREQQVGDVDARNQQDAHDRAEQQPHPRLHPIADDRIDQRPHANAFVLEPGRMLRRERGSDLIHARVRPIERDARLQPADQRDVPRPSTVAGFFVVADDPRYPHVDA
jgi:hypothetical protein